MKELFMAEKDHPSNSDAMNSSAVTNCKKKIPYANASLAAQALLEVKLKTVRQARKHIPISKIVCAIYRCKVCSNFHLTSKPQNRISKKYIRKMHRYICNKNTFVGAAK